MPATRKPKDSGLVGRDHALSAKTRNALPAKSFAFPDERKEPLTDARHVRSAIRLFHRVQDVSDAERARAFRRIQAAAKRFGVEVNVKSWREIMGKRGPKPR